MRPVAGVPSSSGTAAAKQLASTIYGSTAGESGSADFSKSRMQILLISPLIQLTVHRHSRLTCELPVYRSHGASGTHLPSKPHAFIVAYPNTLDRRRTTPQLGMRSNYIAASRKPIEGLPFLPIARGGIDLNKFE